jgi:hypothetical protein
MGRIIFRAIKNRKRLNNMTEKEFVELLFNEKNEMLKMYFNSPQVTAVGLEIDKLGLTKEQTNSMKSIVNSIITDVMYTILLGLDGEASIGNVQQAYELIDESGYELTGSGVISDFAYEYFHEK